MLVLLGNILNGLSLTVPAAYFFEHKVTATFMGQEMGGLTVMTMFYAFAYMFTGAGMFFTTLLSKKLGGMRNVLIAANILTVVARVAAFFVGFEGNRIWISMILFGRGHRRRDPRQAGEDDRNAPDRGHAQRLRRRGLRLGGGGHSHRREGHRCF